MSDKKKTEEVPFHQGDRSKAIKEAFELVKKSGRGAELIICRDIPGPHTGGEACFCDPKVIEIYPEDLE